MTSSLRRALVVLPYGIGDFLFSTPVLRALRLIPSLEKVDVLLGSRTDKIVRLNPHVDEIFMIDKDAMQQRGFWQNVKFVIEMSRRLRKNQYDLMIDYSSRDEYSLWAWLILGISRRAGFQFKKRGLFYNIKKNLSKGFYQAPAANYFCALAESCQIPVRDRFLEFYLPEPAVDLSEAILKEHKISFKNYAVVSPGGGESWGKDAHFKRWPVKNFSVFMEKISKDQPLEGSIVVGSPEEQSLAEELVQNSEMPALNLAGKISLVETALLIDRAVLFVGNDGGLVHIACARRTPVIAFYGPVDPEVYGPYPKTNSAVAIYKKGLECRPCYQNFRYQSDCPTRECLQDLTPEEAVAFLRDTDLLPLKEKD